MHKIGFAFAVACLISSAAGAQTASESSWKELKDDASRQTLFHENVIPFRLVEDETVPENTGPIGLGIPKEFTFPDDAKYDVILKKDRVDVIFGVDISHHNGPINFQNLRLQRVRFVYAKATQGTGFKDGMFATYWKQLADLPENQKLHRGAYHFLSADSSGRLQADRFVDYVNLHGGFKADDMPPCLDLEWDVTSKNNDQWRGHNHNDIIKNALDWMERVKQRTGRSPILYTALAWWKDRGIPQELIKKFDGYTIWTADYSVSHKASEKPAIIGGQKQDLWQFAENARLTTGYKGTLDANIYYGKVEQFERDFGINR